MQAGQQFGKFFLLELLGEGGTSQVFKAIQHPINRVVALKIPNFQISGELLSPDEFLSEATVLAKLEHQNVVRIYDFGTVEDQAYLCMEFVDGLDLLAFLQRHRPLPFSIQVAILIQIQKALSFSHAQKVYHRDLSPRNILLTPSGCAKLTDFGMAGKKGVATIGGKVLGTPSFLSPEHIQGKVVGATADWFSFASLVYILATGGRLLFDSEEYGGDLQALFGRIVDARKNPPNEKLKTLVPELLSIANLAIDGKEIQNIENHLLALWGKVASGLEPIACLQAFLNQEEPEFNQLKQQYDSLRVHGKHKDAMDLLESSLIRDPGNSRIEELLMQPWGQPDATSRTSIRTVDVDVVNTTETRDSLSKTPKKKTEPPKKTKLDKGQTWGSLAKIGFGVIVFMLMTLLIFFRREAVKSNSLIEKSISNRIDTVRRDERNSQIKLDSTNVQWTTRTNEVIKKPSSDSSRKPKQDAILNSQTRLTIARTENAIPRDTLLFVKDSLMNTTVPQSNVPLPMDTIVAQPKLNHNDLSSARLVVLSPVGMIIKVNDKIRFTVPSPAEGWRLPIGPTLFRLTSPTLNKDITSTNVMLAGFEYHLLVDTSGKIRWEKRK